MLEAKLLQRVDVWKEQKYSDYMYVHVCVYVWVCTCLHDFGTIKHF